ncbi:hypothetical protein E2C01_078730 [Portunus trituberculatus]|uniref:Uncharacterized protein n=1 Tax=Portunus trituberculatus TaxID=210409 RepID=A0A5B7INI9_PORTR|nr:hypothetical protein [Portunus trituberculatus]
MWKRVMLLKKLKDYGDYLCSFQCWSLVNSLLLRYLSHEKCSKTPCNL